jgi:hypothetical protein
MNQIYVNLYQSRNERSSSDDIFTRPPDLSGGLVSFKQPLNLFFVFTAFYLRYREFGIPSSKKEHSPFKVIELICLHSILQALVQAKKIKFLINMKHNTGRLPSSPFEMVLYCVGNVSGSLFYCLELPIFFVYPGIGKSGVFYCRKKFYPEATRAKDFGHYKVLSKLSLSMVFVVDHKTTGFIIEQMLYILAIERCEFFSGGLDMFSIERQSSWRKGIKRMKESCTPSFLEMKANRNFITEISILFNNSTNVMKYTYFVMKSF